MSMSSALLFAAAHGANTACLEYHKGVSWLAAPHQSRHAQRSGSFAGRQRSQHYPLDGPIGSW